MADLLFLIPLLPLTASAVVLLFGRTVLGDRSHLLSTASVLGSWILSLAVAINLYRTEEPIHQELFRWIPSGAFDSRVSLFADQLTGVMLIVVTTVGLLVHIYSAGYMKGDPGMYRFFAYLPLFVFSMLMLVLADNFLLMFVFWEAVGLCSYLLISFYFRRRSANNAAKKAFIVNRVGDLGFGLGIMLIFWTFGTISFWGEDGVFAQVPEAAAGTITLIALLLFLGAMGKSAQFPLHTWLPDAMEGPTPVSALIHAATMVTAGIYLVARSQSIFLASDTAMLIVAIIGAFTAFMAATIAITQNDIKRVVAYSTLSQLGYMTLALGTGAWMAAIFHLVTHAFFKGLLFLGAGSVIHGMHDQQDIRVMGGLKKYMPVTYWTFLAAALANAGVIPLAGFWSKDEIIVSAWLSSYQPIGTIVSIVAIVSAFLTSLYMFRLVFKVFHGKPNFDPEVVRPHESPKVMTLPLIALAIPTLLIGFIGVPPENGLYHRYVEPVFYDMAAAEHHDEDAPVAGESAETAPVATGVETVAFDAIPAGEVTSQSYVVAGHDGPYEPHHVSTSTTIIFGIISTIAALGGIAVAWLAYIRGSINPASVARRSPRLYDLSYRKWYFDEIYDTLFVRPLRALARFLWRVVDIDIIDAMVNGVASGLGAISQRLRHVQTGLVANYALAIALGMVLLVGIYLTAFSSLFR
ncbi:MAG TPA: NADH-quinone oxidoreductase subunit L [Thermomicrobiales bacterium]|jgi:NADH-quinone oxidoreductase subunit L|nr:NADH-quinone oxidoreductase subunit L [Thermomicrobiales bacterium]